MSRSNSTSPAKNSAANYESAAKDIEQEKRMVAALKRLSFGHLMNSDPDIPSPDSHYSFAVDTQYLDSYSDSRSASPRSSSPSSGVESAEKRTSETELEFYDSESSFEPQASLHEPDDPDSSLRSTADVAFGEETIWVPANIHPEVNPQQFRNHVKTTIDELLERKISRSKSANRSKRSSLSLSTTDDVDDEEQDVDAANTSFNADSMNPSLRELSTELQAMSRLAGMDSNDAIALARSLSTSTMGYSDVEKLAFDKLGNASYASPQAEMLDLGEEPSQVHYSEPSHSQRPYRQMNTGPIASPPSSKRPVEDFALKRSRRLDYRKNPSPSSLGSQLQSGKAGKLAELRQSLNKSLANDFASGSTSPQSQGSSRNSVQSFNPRNSQYLFSYKKSSSRSPTPSSANSPEMISMVDFASKDSPYLTTSSTAAFEQNIHATKYGQRKMSPKAYGAASGPPPQNQPSPHPHRHKSSPREHRHHSSRPTTQKAPQQNEHHFRGSSRNFSGENLHTRSTPETLAHKEHSERRSARRDKSHSAYKAAYPEKIQGSHSIVQHLPKRGANLSSGKFDENSLSGSPYLSKANGFHSVRRAASADRLAAHEPGYPGIRTHRERSDSHRTKEHRAREKTRELNQNLDLFRDELNDFKEKLNKSERHEKMRDTQSSQIKDPAPEQPEISFDLTSHDVSYDDSLGIEKDVLSELHNDEDKEPTILVESDTVKKPEPESTGEDKNSQFRVVSDSKVPDGLYAKKHSEKSWIKPETQVPSKDADIAVIDDTPTDKQLVEPATSVQELPAENKSEQIAEGTGTKQEAPVAQGGVDEDLVSLSNESPVFVKEEVQQKKRSRKTWLWSKEKSHGKNSSAQQQTVSTPSRSVSSPEILHESKATTSTKEDSSGKENVITKLFKKRRSSSASQDKHTRDRLSVHSIGESESELAALSRVSSQTSSKSQKGGKSSSEEIVELEPECKNGEPTEERKVSDGSKKSRLKNKIKSMAKIHEEKKAPEETTNSDVEDTAEPENDDKPKSTLEVQERLKKTIRRTSKANQPIEFTDSAFGFPLPPPSTSTLVMIDYRFPVHVERAIYRLSHLKLANPKRSLREQVLLSNFMYAYLNLVDHTLHLEQQMSSEEYEIGQPEPDANLLGDQDIDTDFEADGELESDDFETIKIDLSVNDA